MNAAPRKYVYSTQEEADDSRARPGRVVANFERYIAKTLTDSQLTAAREYEAQWGRARIESYSQQPYDGAAIDALVFGPWSKSVGETRLDAARMLRQWRQALGGGVDIIHAAVVNDWSLTAIGQEFRRRDGEAVKARAARKWAAKRVQESLDELSDLIRNAY